MTDPHKPLQLGGGKFSATLKANYYKMVVANFVQVLGKTGGSKFHAPSVILRYDTE